MRNLGSPANQLAHEQLEKPPESVLRMASRADRTTREYATKIWGRRGMPGTMRARQSRRCDDEIAESGLVPQIAIMGRGLWVSPTRSTVVISNTNLIVLTAALIEFR